MAFSKSRNLQESDWSVSPNVTLNHQQSNDKKNQINIRSNTVYPIDDNQYSSKDQRKKSCKLLQWWSSIPIFVRGILLGILTGCIILAIILPIWLINKSATQTNSTNTTPVLRWKTAAITVAGIVGSPGISNNQLNTPYDALVDYAYNMYIADRFNNRIQKYLSGSSTGQTVAGNSTYGSSQSQLNGPIQSIIDSSQNLYIADAFNQRIQFWSQGAVRGTTIGGIGGQGNASNQFNFPYGITLNPVSTSGTLYISDYLNHRIMSYASGATNGTLVFGGVGPGINNTQLSYPFGIYFDSSSNSLVIVNSGANNIVRYVLGANSWTLVAGSITGIAGLTSTGFNYPMYLTFDPMGNMYVSDHNNHRIQFFYAGQSNGTTIAGISGVNGTSSTTLNNPAFVRLDSQLNLYVADSLNHRIQKFLRY